MPHSPSPHALRGTYAGDFEAGDGTESRHGAPPSRGSRFSDVVIASLAHAVAPERFTTAEMEGRLTHHLARLGIVPGTLAALSGIEARRFWPRGVPPSQAATTAAKKAIVRARIDRHRIGLLINTSVCRDYVEPSTASLVHGHLGLPGRCLNFDLSNACLGFLNGMDLAAQMIERRQVDYALVVDGEDSRTVVEATLARLADPQSSPETFRENLATLTLGSGAAAAVLAHGDLVPDGHRYVGSVSLAASEHNHLCRGQVDWMRTDPKGLLTAGLDLAERTWKEAERVLGWSVDVLDHAVVHQVSKVHTEAFTGRLRLGLERVPVIYREHGNVGPAAVPMTLSLAVDEGRVRRGDRIGLMGIGSGLNCAMAEVVW
jgi:3-oxoacyl-[acyl-carrier-protein] synthase III